jgi:hypothetical protein
MGSIQLSGRNVLAKKFTIGVSPGTTLTLTVPVKTITIKPVGGTVFIKGANDADADAFPLNDGEMINLDLSLPYSSATATFGALFTASGTVDVYVIAGH